MNSSRIPVLFTQSRSHYHSYPFTDCYGIDRNALNYKGTAAVIAHPPCRLWGRLRKFSTAPKAEKYLAMWAIQKVRVNGGVLEHPAGSSLFRTMRIPLDGTPDRTGGFLISIDQHWFGFPARKRTYLYIVGCKRSQLPPFPLRFSAVTHSVSNSRNFIELPKAQRSETVPALCQWLFQVQRTIEKNKSLIINP